MITPMENGYRLISAGHDAPILERFTYRPCEDRIFKRTPQGELAVSLYFPYDWTPSDRRPGALLFFGGGWRTGTRQQLARECVYLAAHGMVAATADYRVVDYHRTGVEACLEDAVSAMRWFRSMASTLGVDAERIAVGGESAGGHLAAATAVVVGFDGDDSQLHDVSARPNALLLFNPAIGLLQGEEGAKLGVSPALARRIGVVDDMEVGFPPTWLWFGENDRYLAQARPFIDRARSLAHPFQFMLAGGAGHGYFNDYAEFFEPAMDQMSSFLRSIGYVS